MGIYYKPTFFRDYFIFAIYRSQTGYWLTNVHNQDVYYLKTNTPEALRTCLWWEIFETMRLLQTLLKFFMCE